MPEDLEVSVSFDTDEAVSDLEDSVEDSGLMDLGGLGGDGDGGGGRRRGGGSGVGGLAAGAEIGSDVASGPGRGGIAGALTGILGTLGTVATGVLAIVGLLLLLEPIQQFLGAVLRQLELFVVPLLLLLRPVLKQIQKAVVGLVQILRNPEQKLFAPLRNILTDLVNAFISAVNNIPGVNISPIGNRNTVAGVSDPERARNILTGNVETPESPGQPFNPFVPGVAEDTAFAEKSDEAKKETQAQQNESVLGDYY